MPTFNTPKVNRIYRMTEFDVLRTAITANNMYICTDSLQMYYDESAVKRSKYNYTGIKTINDLMYNTTPSYGKSYYCWEDNSLWLWLNKWITLWADTNYPSAYIYTTYPTPDSPSTINSIYNINNVLDNNGLLQDGSVVIRDGHRIIKGKIFVNDENDNLTFSSFLGGGIRLLPNGELDTNGELFIGDEGKSFLRSSLSILNNEIYVDYSEHPELDNNPYKTDTHKYLVYHEGNLGININDFQIIHVSDDESVINDAIKDTNEILYNIAEKPIMYVYTHIVNGKIVPDVFILTEITALHMNLQGIHSCEINDSTDVAKYTIKEWINTLELSFSQEGENYTLKNIVLTENNNSVDVVPITSDTTTPFIPTQAYQPVTKQYMDNVVNSIVYSTTIGDNESIKYTIKHNLDTQNIIIQLRDNETRSQIFVDNKIIDNNTIEITFSKAPSENSVDVCIIGINKK